MFSITPPAELVDAPSGWVHPDEMAGAVRRALVETVGSVLPFGDEASYELVHFMKKDSAGNPLEVWAGEWVTPFSDTPADLQGRIAETGLSPARLATFRQKDPGPVLARALPRPGRAGRRAPRHAGVPPERRGIGRHPRR